MMATKKVYLTCFSSFGLRPVSTLAFTGPLSEGFGFERFDCAGAFPLTGRFDLSSLRIFRTTGLETGLEDLQ